MTDRIWAGKVRDEARKCNYTRKQGNTEKMIQIRQKEEVSLEGFLPAKSGSVSIKVSDSKRLKHNE